MWEISNSLQAVTFLRAMALGGILGVFYDFFAVLRKLGFNSFWAVFLEDIIFFVTSSPLIFLFLLATTNGEIRFYVIIGIAIGFTILRMTLSRLTVPLFGKIFSNVFRAFFWLNNCTIAFFRLILNFLELNFKKTAVFLKKELNTLKKLLKKR